MAAPIWLSAIGHFFGDVVGGVIGARLGADWRGKAAEEAAREVRRVFLPDREDLMKDLLYLGDEVKRIRELLEEANRAGFVMVNGRRYTENWIVNMLLKVESNDREWVFPILDDVLGRGRKGFFALLEILYNDGIMQWIEVVRTVIGQRSDEISARFDRSARLRARSRLLRRQASVRGWRSWLVF